GATTLERHRNNAQQGVGSGVDDVDASVGPIRGIHDLSVRVERQKIKARVGIQRWRRGGISGDIPTRDRNFGDQRNCCCADSSETKNKATQCEKQYIPYPYSGLHWPPPFSPKVKMIP